MPDRFHAAFGICRRQGGTKKVCYKEALAKVKSRRTKKRRRSSRRRA